MEKAPTEWTRTVSLPVGLFDEARGRLLRQATLRKLTGKEEALLSEPRLRDNGGRLITALLAGCVTALEEQRADAEVMRRLPSADRSYLLLEARRLTFGDSLEAHYRCPHCQGVTAVTEDLGALPVRRAEDGAAALEVTVPLRDGYQDASGAWQRELVFALPTGEDEEVAGGRRDPNPTRQRDVLWARCLRRVGDMDPRRVEVQGARVLADLSMADRRLVQEALDAAAPGPDLRREIPCAHCGRPFQAALDMGGFFPLG